MLECEKNKIGVGAQCAPPTPAPAPAFTQVSERPLFCERTRHRRGVSNFFVSAAAAAARAPAHPQRKDNHHQEEKANYPRMNYAKYSAFVTHHMFARGVRT